MMRNIEESPWLRDERLGGIQWSGSGPTAEGAFTVFANQIRMNQDAEGL
jgi:Tfp pilus assembly protein PilN